MTPFYIKGALNNSIDLREILFEEDPIKRLSEILEGFDILVGYSFGGRLLGEVKKRNEFNNKTWIFVSSRHSPYPKEELVERELFKNKLGRMVQTDLLRFYEYWNKLPLFTGHLMSDFREAHSTSYKPWTEDEMVKYLLDFFNSEQFVPDKDENVHYVYGEKDIKYSKEAKRLSGLFKTHKMAGVGHRNLFENVEMFNDLVREIMGAGK